MKYTIALLVPLICFMYASASAMTVKDYEGYINSENKIVVAMTKRYVMGLGTGFGWSNIELESREKQPLYCPNQKLALTQDNYIQILDAKIASLRKKGVKNLDDDPIEMLLIFGLVETFPCPE